jgi:hypothetical protein
MEHHPEQAWKEASMQPWHILGLTNPTSGFYALLLSASSAVNALLVDK